MGAQSDSNGLPLSGRHNLYNSGFNGTLGCSTCDPSTSGVDSSITEITTGKNLPDAKYYDAYPVNSNGNKANRILGDATGEMGPFSGSVSSWHGDIAWFVNSSSPWFHRGGSWNDGSGAGVFRFSGSVGYASSFYSFRVVLAP